MWIVPRRLVGRELTVRPAQLGTQLAYLKSQGIAAISMAQFERRLQRGQSLDRVVVLTFDDGYADQFRYAVPLLHRYGDSATFYVVTGELGRPRHLTWADLRSMLAQRMDIAAHGVLHEDLAGMAPQQQRFEIDDSVSALRRTLHVPVDSYAYPSGRFNRETLALVCRANVRLGVTTDRTYVLPPQNRLEMTRLRVLSEWNTGQFARALFVAQRSRHAVAFAVTPPKGGGPCI